MSRYECYPDVHPDHIDPETNAPYADYSSDSLDTSFHEHEMDVDDAPDEVMHDALLQWKCPSCGGAKVYLNRTRDGAKRIDCLVCSGNGLHPIAFAALEKAGMSTDAGLSPLEEAMAYLAKQLLNQGDIDWDEACLAVEVFCEIHPALSADELTHRLRTEAYRYEDM